MVVYDMLDRSHWIRHIAITAHYFAHDDSCGILLREGLITDFDAQEISRYIRYTLAPAVKGHAPLERKPVGRPRPSNREVQMKLDFSL